MLPVLPVLPVLPELSVVLALPVSVLVVLMVRVGVALLLRVVAVWHAAAFLVRRGVVQVLLSVMPRICPQFRGGHRPHAHCFRPERLLRLRLRL